MTLCEEEIIFETVKAIAKSERQDLRVQDINDLLDKMVEDLGLPQQRGEK